MDRYHRQTLLPQIGPDGQARLRAAHVLLIGVGALGSTIAEQLVRAGVGAITLVDRDVVEWTNLQRQTLFDESDARQGVAKVEAAARRLAQINADVRLDPRALDVDAANIGSLVSRVDLILDGSDNAELRYLVNDVSVKQGVPWVMGACIGVEGRACGFVPARTQEDRGPCLRCLFEMPPAAGELATCDTAGVLGAAIGVAASMQVAEAMKILLGDPAAGRRLLSFDVWTSRFRAIDLSDARTDSCPCCRGRRFEFLDRTTGGGTRLCGRNAVQVRPPAPTRVDLLDLARRLEPIATLETTRLMLKLVLHDKPALAMSLFGDGRMLVFGTEDQTLARSLYARVVGV